MDPISGSLQGVGAILGAFASLNQAKENRRDREARIRAAEQARRDAMLGTTDAYGNRMYFDPNRGWVTDLTGDSRAIADQQLEEQLAQLFVDAPQRRRAEAANETQRGQQRGQADAFLAELNRITRSDPETMRAMLYDRARMGIDEGYEDVGREYATTALRTGNTNTGTVMAQLARRKADDLRKASLDAAIQAEDRADQRFNTQRGGVANLYAAFADRASRLPQTSYQPMDVTRTTTGTLPIFAGQASAGSNAIINAMASPDRSGEFGPANAFASIGSLLGEYRGQQRADDRFAQALDALKRRNQGVY